MTYSLNFLTKQQVAYIAENYKTPIYVYSERKLKEAIENFNFFPSAF
jgi:diaminopimelate decarboxylase